MIDKGQQEKFMRALGAIVAQVCGDLGCSPEQARRCLAEAALHSGFGRYAFANNFWMLRGKGDAGYYTVTRVWRTPGSSAEGGYRPEVEKLARFSSPVAAVTAWVQAARGA